MDQNGNGAQDPTLSNDALLRIEAIVDRYPTNMSALMPGLWVVQDELGWVPPAAIDLLSRTLEVPRAKIHELLSFYTMFRTEPPARHTLQFCQNISCHILGSRDLLAHVQKRLGVRMGQTTPDGMFALERAECLGGCGHGPVMQLGKQLYEHLTAEKIDSLLESLRKGIVPRADTDRQMEVEA